MDPGAPDCGYQDGLGCPGELESSQGGNSITCPVPSCSLLPATIITPLLYSPGWNDWNSAQFPVMQFYPFMTWIDFLPVLLFDLN